MTDTMTEATREASFIKIGAEGLDAEDIVRQIRERTEERRRNGEFDLNAIARAERFNLANVTDDDDFFDRYIDCLGVVFNVDINDYEIIERRSFITPLLKRFKKFIWNILKFYTYHLWSQQNQVNQAFHSGLKLITDHEKGQIDKLQKRVDELEARLAALEAKSN